jgi:anti-anti-sigma factor
MRTMHEVARFQVRSSGDGFSLAPIGELDMASGPAFAAALDGMISTLGEVVVDMSGVKFMDSAGLNVLCTAARSGAVRLQCVPDQVRRVIEITGLEATLGIQAIAPA